MDPLGQHTGLCRALCFGLLILSGNSYNLGFWSRFFVFVRQMVLHAYSIGYLYQIVQGALIVGLFDVLCDLYVCVCTFLSHQVYFMFFLNRNKQNIFIVPWFCRVVLEVG